MVGVGALKTCSRMAESAFNVGIRVRARWGVVGGGRLTNHQVAIVASDAATGDTRMIKAAVRFQSEKTGGIMAVIAFGVRLRMKFGLTDGENAVMAFTAIAEYFVMINKGENVKPERRMTGLAGIRGGDVIPNFRRNTIDSVVMTNHAIGRQALVIERARGSWFV